MLILISLVQSSILLWLLVRGSRKESYTAALYTAFGLTALQFFCMPAAAGGSLVVFFHAGLTWILVGLLIAIHAKPATILSVAAGIALICYGWGFWQFFSVLSERSELRQEFRLVSIAPRLEYEAGRRSAATGSKQEISLLLASEVGSSLRESEYEAESRTAFGRSRALEALHDRRKDEFAASMGFGVVRMLNLYVSRERVTLPVIEPIPISRVPNDYPSSLAPLGPAIAPNLASLPTLHQQGSFDFLEPNRMGYVQDRDHVAGFEPHTFSKVPVLEDENRHPIPWRIVRLELVSLLRHEEPVAYVSEHLPRMDELKDAATRPLGSFERAALERLQSEQDVVIDEQPNRIRMVGSLRAGESCLKCHSVQRGELLGAFTYELAPETPRPAPKPETKPAA